MPCVWLDNVFSVITQNVIEILCCVPKSQARLLLHSRDNFPRLHVYQTVEHFVTFNVPIVLDSADVFDGLLEKHLNWFLANSTDDRAVCGATQWSYYVCAWTNSVCVTRGSDAASVREFNWLHQEVWCSPSILRRRWGLLRGGSGGIHYPQAIGLACSRPPNAVGDHWSGVVRKRGGYTCTSAHLTTLTRPLLSEVVAALFWHTRRHDHWRRPRVSWRLCSIRRVRWHSAGGRRADAPWQNGECEKHGGLVKDLLAKGLETEVVLTPDDMEDLLAEILRNRRGNRSGFTPYRHVVGQNPRFRTRCHLTIRSTKWGCKSWAEMTPIWTHRRRHSGNSWRSGTMPACWWRPTRQWSARDRRVRLNCIEIEITTAGSGCMCDEEICKRSNWRSSALSVGRPRWLLSKMAPRLGVNVRTTSEVCARADSWSDQPRVFGGRAVDPRHEHRWTKKRQRR